MAKAGPTAESAQFEKSIPAIVPEIEAIMLQCKDKPAGLMQPAVDKIVEMFLGGDLASKKKIQGRHCGIHPENRGQTGVDAFSAQRLALEISRQGNWEPMLTMGFEKALPNTAESAQQEMFMEENFKLSNGYLRPVPFDDVEYLPVTGSHMAAALNIVADGPGRVRGLNEELSTDGYIDHQKAMSLCPSWKKPLTDGMPCIVFRRELETACPELPAFLSSAGNQSYAIRRARSEGSLSQASSKCLRTPH